MIQKRLSDNLRRLTGKYSNDYVRPLVACGMPEDESSFLCGDDLLAKAT